MHPLHTVLFDLDGTLSDSGAGIINGIKYAMEKIDLRVEPDHDWMPYLGPPLRDALADFHGVEGDRLDAAIDAYLEYYRNGGMYENRVYDGMPELIDELDDRGMTLAVATSKRAFMAEGILEHFGLRARFAAVGGAHADGTGGRKHEVIERTLDELQLHHDRLGVVMIGDREHDIHGARVLGLHTIGVRWGYARPGELEAAGADLVVDTVDDLAAVLRPSA